MHLTASCSMVLARWLLKLEQDVVKMLCSDD